MKGFPVLCILSAALALAGAGGCGSDSCGPGEVSGAITVANSGQQATFTTFGASANNDCRRDGAPTAITVQGNQDGGNGFLILCLPRPDRIGGDAIAIEASDDRVEFFDLSAQYGDCRVSRSASQAVTGTVTFIGFCGNGTDPAGFGLRYTATAQVTETCPDGGGPGTVETPVEVTVSGDAVVSAGLP